MVMKTRTTLNARLLWVFIAFAMNLLAPSLSLATSGTEIDIKVQATLKQFVNEVGGAEEFLKKSAGILVFPSVLKAGLVVGGEYGEGALLINNQTANYYSTASASFGFQMGIQSKAIVLVFMTQSALNSFRNNDGWEAGVDGSVAVVEWGVGKDINTVNTAYPIVGFVFDNKGLMLNLTLEGSKFTKIVR